MITGINKSKTLTEHTSCECYVNLMEQNVIRINVRTTIKVFVIIKNIIYVKKVKKYLAVIMDD